MTSGSISPSGRTHDTLSGRPKVAIVRCTPAVGGVQWAGDSRVLSYPRGNELLPRALAKRLGGLIRYGCRVTNVGQDDSGAWAVMEHAEGHETVRGDYVVSALPFSVARNLFADAKLSAEKQRVIRELKYSPVDKVFLQMQRQFWKDKGQSGFANTDLVSERFWALGPESPEERGLLLSYVIG